MFRNPFYRTVKVIRADGNRFQVLERHVLTGDLREVYEEVE